MGRLSRQFRAGHHALLGRQVRAHAEPGLVPGAPRGRAGLVAEDNLSLSIGLVDAAGQANQRYFIIKPRETNFRSFAWAAQRLGMFTHRDLALDWNTRRTRLGRVRHSVSFLQTTILHEFGHTLGLHHVGGRGNADSNYGISLEQRNELMGMGDHTTPRLAQPWINQLRHHLVPARGEAAVRFTPRVVGPQLITYWDNDWVPPPQPAP